MPIPSLPPPPLWKRLLPAALAGALGLLVLVLFRAEISTVWNTLLGLLQQLPWGWYLAALIVLPAVGCPMSPLLLPMSALFGLGPSLLMALAATLAGPTLGYHLAAGLGRPILRKLLAGTRFADLSLPAEGGWLVILAMRLTPGVPYCVQNFVPGLCGYPFGRFLLISWPAAFTAIAAIIALGEGFQQALRGELGAALTAGGCSLAILAGIHWFRSRHAARNPN